MVKKINSKKEDSDYEIEAEEIEEGVEELDELDDTNDNEDDEDNDNEKDDLIIDPETEGIGCDIDDAINDDNIFFGTNDYIEIEPNLNDNASGVNYITKENRISANRMTKYEMVRILGERTKQLTMGAKPLVKEYKSLPYDKIAEEELKLNMIPFKIKRPLPNGKYEIWNIEELQKNHLSPYID